jgi:hypothetical protein
MTSFLKCYLQINLLLFASYFIFRICRTLVSRTNAAVSYQSLTRAAQALLLASLLVPVLFAMVSEKSLSHLTFVAIRPASESASPGQAQKKNIQIHRALPVTAGVPDDDRFTLQAMMKSLSSAMTEFNRPEFLFILLFGFVIMAGRFGKNVAQLRRIISDGIVIRRLGRVIVIVSDSVSAPFSTLIGFNAYAIIPPTILNDIKDFRIAIRHEFQHHRQFDTAWALLIEVWICLFYANPAIYLWKKEVTELQEFSCDEALIGQRGVLAHDYGSCLIRVAEAALGNRQMLVGTACMAAATKDSRYFKSFLRRRIEMFAVHESSRRKKSIAIVLGTVLSLLATVTVAYGAQQVLRSQARSQPNPGHAVFDPNIQAIAKDVLQKAVLSYGAKAGFVLVSDPQTGKLLAAANVSHKPSHDSRPWSLSYLLEPASVIKGVVAASAVDHKRTTFDEMFNCENGQYQYGHNLFHDWKSYAQLTTTDTIVNSSNICGIKIGERLGSQGLAKTLDAFGFGPGGTAESFPEALPGDVPSTDQLTEEEYVALVSIGYTLQAGFKVTPLEMVQAYGAIANDGQLMKPIGANEPDSAASVVRRVLSVQTAQGMKAVLQKAVQKGTGTNAQSPLYSTAGKTGTAFTPGTIAHESLGGERSIASFAGFAPVDHPRVAIYVGIIGPTNLKENQPGGNAHAAPVFRKVTERVLQYLNVPPDKH